MWCPFDTEESEYVKQISANGNKVIATHISTGQNFYTYEPKEHWDIIISNPPFKLAQEFIERALEISNDKVIMFAKIQLLEGKDRFKMWENTPFKKVYVFSKRVNPMRNGSEVDENGKPWSSTMCFAWFVWERNYEGEPIIEWL